MEAEHRCDAQRLTSVVSRLNDVPTASRMKLTRPCPGGVGGYGYLAGSGHFLRATLFGLCVSGLGMDEVSYQKKFSTLSFGKNN